jgi:hypothetical protein
MVSLSAVESPETEGARAESALAGPPQRRIDAIFIAAPVPNAEGGGHFNSFVHNKEQSFHGGERLLLRGEP